MKSPEDKHHKIIDPVAAEVVRKIFDWRVAGKSAAQIANQLNAEGAPTPTERKRQLGARRQNWNSERNKNEWNSGQITRILRDEQYTGKLIACKTERRVLGDASSSRKCDPSEWILIPDAFEAIVTQEQFDAAQQVMTRARSSRTAVQKVDDTLQGSAAKVSSEPPLFYRKLKCGVCGLAPLRKQTARPYYQCGAKAWNSGDGCRFVRIFEDELVKAVLASIRVQAQLARKLQQQLDHSVSRPHSGKNGRRILALRKKLDDLDAQRKKLYLAYHEGDSSKAEFDAMSEAISRQWKECQQELTVYSARNSGSDAAVYRKELDELAKLSNLRSLDRETVDRLIRTVRIFEENRIEIVWNFSSPYAAMLKDYERKANDEGTK